MFSDQHQIIIHYLTSHHLSYELHTHAPMFTADSASNAHARIPGAHSKNLFVKDKKKNYFLISVLEHKKVNLNLLSKSIAKSRVSFASESELEFFLGVKPGSVTPYGLIYDLECRVHFLLDEDFFKFEQVNFHPLRNDMTLSTSLSTFLNFCKGVKHSPQVIEIPVIESHQ